MNQWQSCHAVEKIEYHFDNSNSMIVIYEPLWWRYEEVLGQKFEYYLEKSGKCCQVPSGWCLKVVIPFNNTVTRYTPGGWEIQFYDGSRG